MSSQSHSMVRASRILVVEDSPTQAQRLQHVLEQEGHTVDVAGNGRIALEKAKAKKPALVLSDIVMPEMDGYAFTRHLKAIDELRDVPVVLVTTMSDPQDVILGLECGADNFVVKPYDERYLISRIHYMLINREFHKLTARQEPGIAIHFNNQRHFITADRMQILNLLLSTYEAAMQRNRDLRQSQEELERRSAEVVSTNRFLDSLIENIPNMVFIKDVPELRFVHLNRAGEQLLGVPRAEVLGKTDRELFPREEADFFSAKDRQVLASGAVDDIPEETMHTAGGVRILHTKKVPLLDDRGRPKHLLGISEDVTEQRTMQREILRLNTSLGDRARDLEAMNKELESFSYSVSHDLRAPLHAIDGFAQVLEERCAQMLDDGGRRHLRHIRDNARKMGVLIDELLQFSQLARRPVEKVSVNMGDLVAEVVEAAVQQLPGARPQIEIGALPSVMGDEALLRQVWTNLISNAIKYSGKVARPEITVSGYQFRGELVYTVRDNGAGFDMAYYERLFEPFQRAHLAREFEGTGIGLAIVRRVVERHGGRVWAESKVEQGARFHFALPGPTHTG
jgi:PAS domain S-box-containing protein